MLGRVANFGVVAWTVLKLFPLLCAETAIRFSKWNVPFGMFFYHLHFADRSRVGRTNFEQKFNRRDHIETEILTLYHSGITLYYLFS